MTSIDLLKFMLPDYLIENFEIVSAANSEENLHLYFEEKAKPPKEFDAVELVSKGFLDEITIQDFPLRGKMGKTGQLDRFLQITAKLVSQNK